MRKSPNSSISIPFTHEPLYINHPTLETMAYLAIPPEDATGNSAKTNMVDAVNRSLEEADLAIYCRLQGESAQNSVFVARSPYKALQWICKRITRPKLVRAVQHIYDHPSIDVDGERFGEIADSDADSEDRVIDNVAGTDSEEGLSASRKRKRPGQARTKKQINKALVENMNLAFTVASTQDWKQAKMPSEALVGEQQYREFASKLPGVGVHTAARMISMAMAVGTMDVFRDWHAIVTVWKRQNSYGKKLFQRVAVGHTDVTPSASATVATGDTSVLIQNTQDTLSSQHSIWQQVDEAGLTLLETEAFREKFFDAQKTQVDGIADYMRHRWKMDALYEEYLRLKS